MSIYTQWNELTKRNLSPEESHEFWKGYLLKEKEVYRQILESKEFVIETTVKEFAEKYNLETIFTVGYIEGINDSLKEQIVLQSLEEDTKIKLDIDLEKLYYNMHNADAEWLYNLPEWNDILPEEKRIAIEKEYKASKTFVKEVSVSRNEPCTCGSGKKFKKCCGR